MHIEIINCWTLANKLIIIEVAHEFNGLPQGTTISDRTNEWHIDKRIVFKHLSDKQILFENESTTQSSLSFANNEAEKESTKQIIENEARGIFQYTLKENTPVYQGIFKIYHNNLKTIVTKEEQNQWISNFEYPKYSPEYWAAKFGHNIGCGDLRKHLFQDKDFEKWCHRLFEILHSKEIYLLREKLLTPEERKEIEDEIEGGF